MGMTGSGWLWDGFRRQKWWYLLKHCMWGVKEQVKEGPRVLACTAGGGELTPCGIGTVREGKGNNDQELGLGDVPFETPTNHGLLGDSLLISLPLRA